MPVAFVLYTTKAHSARTEAMMGVALVVLILRVVLSCTVIVMVPIDDCAA